MKIKTTQQKAPEPPFIPVVLEILIETKEEGQVIEALFNSAQIESVTMREFGAATSGVRIPGSGDSDEETYTARLNRGLSEFYTKK